MKTQLLNKIYASLISAALSITSANAQIIYTDVDPDFIGMCIGNNNNYCEQNDSIDINNNAIKDFIVHASTSPNGQYCGGFWYPKAEWSVYSSVSNSNNAIAVYSGNDVHEFGLGDTIDSSQTWNQAYVEMKSYLQGTPCTNPVISGLWFNQIGYLGLRLKIAAQFHYGWARMEVIATYDTAKFTLFDYAINSIPNQFILAGDTGTGPVGIIENVFKNEINISPNPFTTSTTLTINSLPLLAGHNALLKIFDVMGREVKQLEIINLKTQIKKENLSSGIYCYKVQSGNEIIGMGKMIVQ